MRGDSAAVNTVVPARSRPTRPRRRLIVALAVVGAVVLSASWTPAFGQTRRGPAVGPTSVPRDQALRRWQEVVAVFDAAGSARDPLFVAADAAAALAEEVSDSGWHSPKVPRLVAALVGTANPDGGYGLGRPWDAYQDGTVNPATTSYTATTAGHVGPILVAGHRAGVIAAPVVDRAIDWVLDLPHPDGDPCIPYSNSPNDVGRACVWNVHYAAAAWVVGASAATGHRRDDATALAATALSMLADYPPDPKTGYFPYSAAQDRPQDLSHQLWTALAIDGLRGGRQALDAMLAGSLWREQAKRFHDANVASALGRIALSDCRYATDPLVLRYASSTTGGSPYLFKALAIQARQVIDRCFTGSGTTSKRGTGASATSGSSTSGLLLPNLG